MRHKTEDKKDCEHEWFPISKIYGPHMYQCRKCGHITDAPIVPIMSDIAHTKKKSHEKALWKPLIETPKKDIQMQIQVEQIRDTKFKVCIANNASVFRTSPLDSKDRAVILAKEVASVFRKFGFEVTVG